jgi:hypothetical protein
MTGELRNELNRALHALDDQGIDQLEIIAHQRDQSLDGAFRHWGLALERQDRGQA